MLGLARIVVPGEARHITQRVNNGQDVFFVEDDRKVYLGFLREYAARWKGILKEKAAPAFQQSFRLNTHTGRPLGSDSFLSKRKHTGVLRDLDVRIRMDGRGRALDNVFIERLWRSVKYEDIYLHEYADGHELHHGQSKYFQFYNHERL